MADGVLDLLSTVAVVVVVGVVALCLLIADLVRRELAGPRSVAVHYRAYGVATAVVFLVLVTVRFETLGR